MTDLLPRDPTGWEHLLLGAVLNEPLARVDLEAALATVEPSDWSSPDRADLWRWLRRLVARDGVVCVRTLVDAAHARRRADLARLALEHWGAPPPGCSVLLLPRYVAEVARSGVLRRLRELREAEERALSGEAVAVPDGPTLGPLASPAAVVDALAPLREAAVARTRGLSLASDPESP